MRISGGAAALAPLRFLARNGRAVLTAGLLAGVLFPELALHIKNLLPALVALTLFVAALRIGAVQARGSLQDMRNSAFLVLLFQLALPCALVLLLGLGKASGPMATALILMASASSISGSPNLTLLTGNDPAAALRLLIAGTAMLPLTIIPVFWLSPVFGEATAIISASGRLLLLIAAATLAAFTLRRIMFPDPTPETLQAIDGLSALVMAVMVVGLMSAVGPALRQAPHELGIYLAAAFAANFGLQLLAFYGLSFFRVRRDRVAFSVVAGNRNMALFLAALPASVTDPILLFIGCYQVPMYLTPILLFRLYAGKDRPIGFNQEN